MASPEATGGSHASFCAVAPGGGQHAAAHHRADEVRGGRQGPPQLLVERHALDERHARAAVLLGQQQADEVELAQLRPQRGGIADRVVLHVPHDVEASSGAPARRARSGAAAPAPGRIRGPALSTTFVVAGRNGQRVMGAGEGRHWSPRRAHGLSSAVRGRAMRAAHVVLTSPSTDSVTRDGHEAAPRPRRPRSTRTTPRSDMVSPGKTEPFMRNVTRPSRPWGPVQSVR